MITTTDGAEVYHKDPAGSTSGRGLGTLEKNDDGQGSRSDQESKQ
jgi:hypothetical protein